MLRISTLVTILLAATFAGLPACGEREGDEEEGEGDNSPPKICSTHSASSVEEGTTMSPGGDCNGCHSSHGEGPAFTIVGTVMGAMNDDTNCNGVGGVEVDITGADGVMLTLTTNSAGNFYTQQSVARPFHAKVLRGSTERAMVAAQAVGDCNTCHTARGANNAPGRIVAP